jgi:hypothetical protein
VGAGTREREALVSRVVLEPRGERHAHAALRAGRDEVDQRGKDADADAGRSAPHLGVPGRQNFPFAIRVGGDEVRVGVDAHGVVAALDEFIERL